MTLIGQGAMASWHDLAPNSDSRHDDWHSHQHMAERVGIPGFKRGRRYRCIEGGPEYFLIYEVDDLAVLTSDAYQQRLNNPTDWTKEIVPTVINMCRTLCRVELSAGHGVGGYVLTIRMDSSNDQRDQLLERLRTVAGRISNRMGLTSAHIPVGDAEARGVSTKEKTLRDSDQRPADIAIIVEAYDLESLRELSDDELSASSLQSHGAVEEQGRGLYRLAHCLGEDD